MADTSRRSLQACASWRRQPGLHTLWACIKRGAESRRAAQLEHRDAHRDGALAGGALAVAVGSIVALLVTLLLMGAAARISMVASTLAGTHGPVALRSEGTASAFAHATRQSGSALGVAILSATLVVAPGSTTQRTEIAMLVAACFALAWLLATRIVPAGRATVS